MTNDTNLTMREFFEQEGYDTDSLTHPRNVRASDLREDSRVIAYTVVSNPDIDGPATTWDIVDWELGSYDGREFPDEVVIPIDNVEDFTDGTVSYIDDSEGTHSIYWAEQNGIPTLKLIGYGDAYDAEKLDWDRLKSNVLGLSDDFVRFDV